MVEIGQAGNRAELRQQIHDLGANAHVQRGDGLIAHDELGPGRGKCARDADAAGAALRRIRAGSACARIHRGRRRAGVRKHLSANQELNSTGQAEGGCPHMRPGE